MVHSLEGGSESLGLGQREFERRVLVESAKPGFLSMQACSAIDHFIVGSSARHPNGEVLDVVALAGVNDNVKLFTPGFLMDTAMPEGFRKDVDAVNLARDRMQQMPIKGIVTVLDLGVQIRFDAQGVLTRVSYSPVDTQTGLAIPEWKIGLIDENNQPVILTDLLQQLKIKDDEFTKTFFSLSGPAEDGTMTLSFKIQ